MKIKKVLCLLLAALSIVLLFSACSNSDKDYTGKRPEKTTPQVTESKNIDLDLTSLSSTMVYSEVYNIMTKPTDYIGKKIKMKGAAALYEDPEDGSKFYACIIKDATACCQQGIEFKLKSGNYPDLNTDITVTGTFEAYQDKGQTYYHLANAYLE